MVKLETKKVLLDFKKAPLKDNTGRPLVLGEFLSDVLSYSRKNHARCYILAKKLATEKVVELKSEDCAFIKEVLSESDIASITVGQILELLD